MKLLKSPAFATIINILAFSCTLICLIFVSLETSVKLFIISLILFIFFLIINILFKNWKYVLVNTLILIASLYGAYKYIDWATLKMYQPNNNELQNGDIIFQTSKSSQSKAIQIASNSIYSHVGIIYRIENEFYVFEASSKVKLTPLDEWINNGVGKKYVVKRIKDYEKTLTQNTLKNMKSIGEKFKAKNYDKYFNWSDNEIYCSELVWKIYKRAANIELGKLEKLSDLNLNKEVIDQLNKRYKGKVPYNQLLITPAQIFNSDKLITISENN